MTDRRLHGRCLCGAVEYVVPDAFLYAGHCHCRRCRRATGSAFSTFGGIDAGKVEIAGGAGHIAAFQERRDKRKLFCRICSSALYAVFATDGPDRAHVQLGTLTNPPTVRPGFHIYVGSKADWYEIRDDLPQHREHPQGGLGP